MKGKLNENRKNKAPEISHVYLIGSGIASLASAVYLEKDAGVPGENIHILEKDRIAGGALDGAGETEKGFVVRGGECTKWITNVIGNYFSTYRH